MKGFVTTSIYYVVLLLFADIASSITVRRTGGQLPDPTCSTGRVSLKMSLSDVNSQVCCPAYCGECSDYPTCRSVRGQNSTNACCSSQVYSMRCGGGAPANVCLKACSESLPPCIMDRKDVTPPRETKRSAAEDCNKAVSKWRLQSAAATAGKASCTADGRADVSACDEQSAFLKGDGTAWGAGDNWYLQFGIGSSKKDFVVPQKSNISGVDKIFTGYSNTLFLKGDGTLWGVGHNGRGQLHDDEDLQKIGTPMLVATDVQSASAGNWFTLIIKKDGTVWGRGWNRNGELGIGNILIDEGGVFKMTQMLKVSNAKKTIVGNQYGGYSLILQHDGTVWATGRNRGQFCTGDEQHHHTPVQVLSDVKDIFSGADYTTFFIKSDNSLWGCGCNRDGQLGVGSKAQSWYLSPVQITTVKNVRNIIGGYEHTIFLTEDESAWVAGSGDDGALGHGSEDDSAIPLKVPIDGVVKVAAGDAFSLFLDKDCNVWSTGDNDDGAIMDPDTFGITNDYRLTPKEVWTLK